MNRIVTGIWHAPTGGRTSSELHRFAWVSRTLAMSAIICCLYESPSFARATRGMKIVNSSSQFPPMTSRYGNQYSTMFQKR